MFSKLPNASRLFFNSVCITSSVLRPLTVNCIPQSVYVSNVNGVRWFAKKRGKRSDCRMAKADLPPEANPECPEPCEVPRKKKLGVLHWLKLKVVEGGTNFGS